MDPTILICATASFSQGTLFAYGAVCLGCLWRRYCVQGETPVWTRWMVTAQITGIIACGFW